MPSGYRSQGVDFDDLFDPDVVGDGPAAAGYTVAGAPLKYAALKYGTKRANVGYAVNGSDASNLWAAKGTASYNLPIEGKSYQSNQSGLNGTAQLIFSMKSDGTYTIVRSVRGVLTTLDTGTWLPAGDNASQYTCKFVGVQTVNSLVGDASFNNITNAGTAQALTTTRTYTADSSVFTELGAVADQSVAVTMSYYRLGVLVHDVHVTFGTRATS